MSVCTSAFVTGRRYASRAMFERILTAQVRSSAAALGWHTKIARRLGVSVDDAESLYGPPICTEWTRA